MPGPKGPHATDTWNYPPLNAPFPRHSLAADPRALLRELAPYRKAETGRSFFELGVTALPFALLWATMCVALQAGYMIALVLALPAGGFLLRLFLIQHDCGHGAFFGRQSANDWVGRILGTMTLTPYD